MDIWNTIVDGLHGIGVHVDKDTADAVGQAVTQAGQAVSQWAWASLMALAAAIVVGLALSRLRLARRILAVGSNPDAAVMRRLACVERLLQRIKHEVGAHRRADAPAYDAPGEHVDDEGHVNPALPGRDIGEVRHPQLVRTLGPEVPVDPVQRANGLLITHITHPSLRACTAMAAYVLRHRAIWAPVLPTRSVD